MKTTAQQLTLDKVPVGTQATLVRIGGAKRIRRRLLDMGMIPGETVRVKALAPLGDPLELVVKGYQLSLRQAEAQQIVVEVNHANGA